jgi:nucleoside-diphosphate-sugar epimerase
LKRALVTGGSGFFGEILVSKLSENNWDVYNLDLNPSKKMPFAKQFIGDIRDIELCNSATQGMDAVFHNVAQVPLAKDSDLFFSVNVNGTANILQAAAEAKVSNFVYTSSSAIFGLPEILPIRKDSIPNPIEDYGAAKLCGENLCKGFFDSDMNIKIVRPRTILGAGRMGIFGLLYRWVQSGVDIYLLGNGQGSYQFVHADDLAEGIIRSLTTKGNQVFNLGALEFDAFKDDLVKLCDYAGTGSTVKSVPDFPFRNLLKVLSTLRVLPFAPYQLLLYGKPMFFDSAADWEELGYRPRYSNLDCLTTGYDGYLSNVNVFDEKVSTHKSSIKSFAINIISLFLKFLKKIS